jgi:hypothetical protein
MATMKHIASGRMAGRAPQQRRQGEYLSPGIFTSKAGLLFTIIPSALEALHSF